MGKLTTWTGATVKFSGALPAAVNITGVSGSGVVSTASTTGISVGSFVLLSTQGMSPLNGKVFKVSAVVANVSFTLESVDTTNYDAFVSGTYQLVTFANTLATSKTVNASGGDFDEIDTTLLADLVKSSIPGMASAAKFEIEAAWDPSDAGYAAAQAASDIQQVRAWQIKFRNGAYIVFAGYVGAVGLPGGSGLVTTKVSISAQGGVRSYAS